MSHRSREHSLHSPPPQADAVGISHGGTIASLAYAIWESRGRPEGTDRQDWFEAEERLRAAGGGPTRRPDEIAEQSREAAESRQAHAEGPSIRERMVSIGRGNQQAGRQGH